MLFIELPKRHFSRRVSVSPNTPDHSVPLSHGSFVIVVRTERLWLGILYNVSTLRCILMLTAKIRKILFQTSCLCNELVHPTISHCFNMTDKEMVT